MEPLKQIKNQLINIPRNQKLKKRAQHININPLQNQKNPLLHLQKAQAQKNIR